jgi:hypothetical protein
MMTGNITMFAAMFTVAHPSRAEAQDQCASEETRPLHHGRVPPNAKRGVGPIRTPGI